MQDKVLAVMQDLMFMVRVQRAAKQSGLDTDVVKNRSDAVAKAAQQPVLVVIDLNYDAGEPLALIYDLKTDPATSAIHLLAFVSHVRVDLRAAATAAGCDTVLPRSVFEQRLPEVIQDCLSSRSPR